MARIHAGFLAILVFATCAKPSASAKTPSAVSDVLKAPRPKGGEWFGLYLMGKKVGYAFTDLFPEPGAKDRVRSINRFVFKASVGGRVTERVHEEVRIYESKPDGRLLSFVVTQSGDGGDQTMEGTATADGVHVILKRPGQTNQVKNLPPTRETVEDADQARVALFRNARVDGIILDGTDLETYKVWSAVEKPEERLIRGVTARLRKVTTINEHEQVPATAFFADSGAVMEIDFGNNMRAVAETETSAQKLDTVEVFALTRVVLPKPLPATVRDVPNTVHLLVSGLADTFLKNSYRQHFQKLADGEVDVTVTASAPDKRKVRLLPLEDPAGGENLKDTIAVDIDDPKIQATARSIVGDEKDAYVAARKISAWVASHMQSDYGASSDRASDALRALKGDCTEHSLLSVALMRAVGIPAKRIDGLVYMVSSDNVPALYWHEWVEAYVGDWTQLDPTFNETVADAAHLAVGEEGKAEITPLIGSLKVLDAR